ncbi:MAG: radical SAM protein [Nanoarchaeota archaeon]|nr:radical SAM protein [Nanoarchaeota archaeon]
MRGENICRLEESPTLEKSWSKDRHNLAIVFPNLYYGGVYSLGPLIVYNLVNHLDDWNCERRFLDYSDIRNFDVVGFTFQYELDYYNLIKILKKNNIPEDKNKREPWKIFFGGGPSVTLNSRPVEKYLDVIFLGDCEDSLPKVLEAYNLEMKKGKNNFDKKIFFENICNIEGVYVPGMSKRTISKVNLENVDYPLVQPLPVTCGKEFVFGNSFILELERGCPYNCKFCVIPTVSGFRYRKYDDIINIIDQGLKINSRSKVVIYSPSFVHPDRNKIMKYMTDKNIKFSVPSLRAELVDRKTLEIIYNGGQRSITIAPESSERVRKLMNKNVKDESYLKLVKLAGEVGFKKVKLYLVVGFECETEEDISNLVRLVKKCADAFGRRITASVNVLVPKLMSSSNDWKVDKTKAKKKLKYIKDELKSYVNSGKVKIKIGDVNNSFVEWNLSVGEKI